MLAGKGNKGDARKTHQVTLQKNGRREDGTTINFESKPGNSATILLRAKPGPRKKTEVVFGA